MTKKSFNIQINSSDFTAKCGENTLEGPKTLLTGCF